MSRAAAVRAAQDAKARRDAERLRREKQVESALADFYEQRGRAESLRSTASARAAKIVADAEAAAQKPERLARAAIAVLQDLGETRDQIAELTGLALAEVRTALAEATAVGPGQPVAEDGGSTPAESLGEVTGASEAEAGEHTRALVDTAEPSAASAVAATERPRAAADSPVSAHVASGPSAMTT